MNLRKQDIRGTSPVEELIGNPPSAIVRWGITLILGILTLAIIGSWMISYPYVVSGRVIITTSNPPASIMAHISGRIKKLYVEEGQRVTQNEYLALLETSANLESVLWLSDFAKNSSLADEIPPPENEGIPLQHSYELGELYQQFSSFLTSYTNYYNHIKIDFYGKKIDALLAEISGIDNYILQLNRQEKLYIEKLKLARIELGRDSTIFAQNVISRQEYENSKEAFFNSQIELEQVRLDRSSKIIDRSSKIQILEDFKAAKEEEKSKLQSTMENERLTLLGELEAWYMKHMLVSPIDGVVTFSQYWGENQVVNLEDVVMTVVPEGESKLVGRIAMPMRGSGKINAGQKVLIKLDGYPFLEYGLLEGSVISKSLIANEELFIVYVDLPGGMVTNHDRVLQFTQNMSGSAEIVTDDMRLIERLVYPFRYIIEKNRLLREN